MSLTAPWVAHWHRSPDHAVVVDAATGATWTGAELDRRTALVSRRLHALGVRPGDRVVLSCPPSAATVALYAGILRLGAVVVPANTAYTRAELEHVVGDVRPVLALVAPDDTERVPVLPLGLAGPDLALDHADERSGAETGPVLGAGAALDAAGDDDPAMIAYTSGTTGRPKGAVLSHANLRSGAEALVEAWEWSAEDRLVHALPLFHMHGLGAAVNGTFAAGASMVVLPRFDPQAVADAVAAHDATLFFGVPTMYARLRDAGVLPRLRGLRLLVSGSAPLDPALFAAVADGAGQAPVERYGMSETVMLTSNPVRGERRAGSVGLPLPGVEVRLGDGGAVEVHGPNVFRGYWERPEANAAAFTPDGFFRTGDVGELDDDGYLRLVGRASDLIITGGYNVYPREVEDTLLDHPDVLDAAVVGLPDATWGETVAAYVVLRPGSPLAADAAAAAEELARHVAGRLAAYKHPRTWTVVDALPRNAMGKVRRDVLRGTTSA